MTYISLIVVALLVDSALGEPRWLWSRIRHPVVWMGAMIGWLDRRLNNGKYRRAKGLAALGIILGIVIGIGTALAALPDWGVLEVLGAAILIGHRSLVQHVLAVADGLDRGLDTGREAVAKIVGRDVSALDEAGVSRAAIESAAENFSDGVVAPVFWFVLFGLPGIMAYKLVNTADSMIGYRSEKYEQFGWAAARLDDVVNYIPARISAALITFVAGDQHTLTVISEDARHHRSPNAGWPEAAVAGALDVALSGPRIYDGQRVDYKYVNPRGGHGLGAAHIRQSVRILWQSWGLMLAGLVIAALARGL